MNIFAVTQIIFAVLLIAAILIQQKGTGLGSTFGGEGQVYRSKRGAERLLFMATIVLAILFAANAILTVVRG
ncbi:preprotein translocase subunit SecG [Candidatus Microgenomates bacterium]|nr:preprotein translocase subunit SecG [Candidatus Microgenomates bacterium]